MIVGMRTESAAPASPAELGGPLGLAGLPDTRTTSLASDAALYTAATYAAQILIFLGGIVQKGILGPENTGFWTLMGTAWSVLAIVSLGVVQGAIRQIPHYRGRGELDQAAATADTAFTFSQLAMGLGGLALAAFALAFGGDWAPELRWGLMLVGLIAPLRNLVDCYEILFQATKRFTPLAVGLITKGLVVVVIQTLLVIAFGYYGMFAGLVALSLATLAVYRRMGLSGSRTPAFHRRLERRRVGELSKFGIPIYVYSQAWVLFLAIDSLIVANFVGVDELGYYGLALSVTSYIILLPRTVVQTVFPRMQERYSASGEAGAIRHYARDTQLVLAFMLVPPFVAAAYFFVPVLIRQALPAFDPAITVVHIIVAGSFLIALVELPVELIITIGKRWNLSALMVGALAFNAAANYVAVAVLDGGIEGAAYATVLSYLALLFSVTAYGFGATSGRASALRQLVAIGAVVVYSLGAMWGLGALLPSGGSAPHDVAWAIGGWLAFCALLVPWGILVQRRYGAVSMLRDAVSSIVVGARNQRRRDVFTGSPPES